MQFRKKLQHTFRHPDQFTLPFSTNLFFRFHFIMKQKQKLIFSFLMQKRMAVELFDVISI